jgi:hypothetical protein
MLNCGILDFRFCVLSNEDIDSIVVRNGSSCFNSRQVKSAGIVAMIPCRPDGIYNVVVNF